MNRHLYDSFASRWYRGSTVWFYADTHFGEPKMAELRHISDEEQIKLINSKIGKKDTIVILGDVGNPELIKQIRGYKVLVMGNHDNGASNYTEIFDEVYEGPVMISDKIILSHEPILNLPDYMYNIHGHVHFQSKENRYEYRYKYLNVCGDSIDYLPISINQIVKSGLLKHIGDIHREAIERGKARNGNTNLK